jgi:hypothetical protein
VVDHEALKCPSPIVGKRGTEQQRGCLVDVSHQWLHLSPLGDCLGVFIMTLLLGYPTQPNIQRLQVQVAGCGIADECRPFRSR